MMLWLILALMTAGALGAVVWPLVRGQGMTAAGSDLVVYRDQLEEIERDRTDARIDAVEAEAARVEVSRRLLAAANAANARPAETGSTRWRRTAAAAATVIMIPMLAVALYGVLGSPDLPGQPLAARLKGGDENLGSNSIAQLIARIEAHLEENPDDGRGWEIVAPVYMKLDRYEDAEAARLWRALIAKAPPDAPWLTVVRQSLARVAHPGAEVPTGDVPIAAAPAPAPPAAAARGPRPEDIANAAEMTDQQRSEMIRGMVDQLATRLHKDGSDLDGWLRLLRAYKVLGDHAKTKAAVAEARAALAGEPDKLHRLDAAIKDLDIGG